MDVPAVVLAIVLAEAAVGGLVFLWFAPTWGAVRHGYEVLLGSTLALMAWGASAALRVPLETTVERSPELAGPAGQLETALFVTAVLATVSVVAIAVRAPAVGRWVGIAATLTGLASFLPFAVLRAERLGQGTSEVAIGVVELLAGAFLLGAIWDGMVLGHWYLVERKLSNRYMIWIAWVNVAAVAAGYVSVALSARRPVPCAGLTGGELEACALTFSPILTIGSMTIIMGAGVLALIAIIAGFNVKLAHEGGRSIQASTGMFYLAVILAPAAEFAAKVRFY